MLVEQVRGAEVSTDSPSGGGVNGERTAISGGGPGRPSDVEWEQGIWIRSTCQGTP